MKNVLVGDRVFIDETQKSYQVVRKTKGRVFIEGNGQRIEVSKEYADEHYVKCPHVSVNETVRLNADYKSRYFTCYEQLEIMFMDLEEQDCIVKSLMGIYEQVPIEYLLKWAEDPHPQYQR